MTRAVRCWGKPLLGSPHIISLRHAWYFLNFNSFCFFSFSLFPPTEPCSLNSDIQANAGSPDVETPCMQAGTRGIDAYRTARKGRRRKEKRSKHLFTRPTISRVRSDQQNPNQTGPPPDRPDRRTNHPGPHLHELAGTLHRDDDLEYPMVASKPHPYVHVRRPQTWALEWRAQQGGSRNEASLACWIAGSGRKGCACRKDSEESMTTHATLRLIWSR